MSASMHSRGEPAGPAPVVLPAAAAARPIRLLEVSLSRDEQPVLDDVSLTLTESRIGIIGNNGSGKSSLVRLLNGLLQPTRGRVLIGELDTAVGPEPLSGLIGFIFQNPDHQLIFPTVIEELAFGLRNQGLAAPVAQARALAWLERHGRAQWAERPVHALSEGQKQWLCIMAVLVMEPSVLILDEPFSALDLPTRLTLTRWLLGLRQQIIMISHDLEVLQRFERVVWLEGGRVRGDGEPATVLAAYRASSMAGVTL